ncbi:MAG: protein kinase, partial [Planctomycetota bacterium]
MNQSSGNSPADSANDIWAAVAESLERFVASWDLGDPIPEIADFLPPVDAPSRDLALIELVKLDLEHRFHGKHEIRSLADYAAEFPDLIKNNEYPSDLLYEEYHQLNLHSPLTPSEYAQRYPNQSPLIMRMVATDDRFETTSILPSRVPTALKPGDVVSEFELVRRLGSGAFATVFLALQRSMQRLVAVKISSDHGKEPETLAKLDHPNIVRVYDQRTDEPRRLLVLYMQYLPAGTLQNALL